MFDICAGDDLELESTNTDNGDTLSGVFDDSDGANSISTIK